LPLIVVVFTVSPLHMSSSGSFPDTPLKSLMC
jgi:hypothetical protein